MVENRFHLPFWWYSWSGGVEGKLGHPVEWNQWISGRSLCFHPLTDFSFCSGRDLGMWKPDHIYGTVKVRLDIFGVYLVNTISSFAFPRKCADCIMFMSSAQISCDKKTATAIILWLFWVLTSCQLCNVYVHWKGGWALMPICYMHCAVYINGGPRFLSWVCAPSTVTELPQTALGLYVRLGGLVLRQTSVQSPRVKIYIKGLPGGVGRGRVLHCILASVWKVKNMVRQGWRFASGSRALIGS